MNFITDRKSRTLSAASAIEIPSFSPLVLQGNGSGHLDNGICFNLFSRPSSTSAFHIKSQSGAVLSASKT